MQIELFFQNVERAFALLLLRFPRVTRLNQKYLRKKIKVVMTSCILHNLCIIENDNIEYFLERAREVFIGIHKYINGFLHQIYSGFNTLSCK